MLTALWWGGCSSAQMSRIDSNRDIYEQWPVETKQAVLDGKVEQGMTPEMVQVSWGKPTEVVGSPGGGPGDEIWVYKRGGLDENAMMGMPSPSNPGGGIYPGTYPGGTYPGGTYPGGTYPGGGGGNVIGISTGRGGTGIITGGGIGIGGGAIGSPVMSRQTPADVREVVFRNGVVHRADPPFDAKEPK